MRARWDMQHPLAGLDHYTRATLNVVSWNSESNWPNDLEGQGQWPPFSIPAVRIPRCIFSANLVILAQIHVIAQTSQISLEFWVKMAKMTLKFKVSDLHIFNTS